MHSDQKTTTTTTTSLSITMDTMETMEKAFSGYIDYLNSSVVEDDEDNQYIELEKVKKRLGVLKKKDGKTSCKKQ